MTHEHIYKLSVHCVGYNSEKFNLKGNIWGSKSLISRNTLDIQKYGNKLATELKDC